MIGSVGPISLNVFMFVEMSAEMSTELQIESTTLEVDGADTADEYLESAEMDSINNINKDIQAHAADGGEGGTPWRHESKPLRRHERHQSYS